MTVRSSDYTSTESAQYVRKNRNSAFTYLTIAGVLAIGLAVGFGINLLMQSGKKAAISQLRDKQVAATSVSAKDTEKALTQIYQNIRTLSFLPDVQTMERHAENLTPSSKATIQQIYNNLWSNVTVSEIYFVPESFDPDKIDPATKQPEAPALMFDEMITGSPAASTQAASATAAPPAGEPQVETEEYALIKKQIAYYRQQFPTASKINGLNVPIIAGPMVVTCDNSEYDHSKLEADRQGLVFSVPYFAPTGEFKGVVSAIVRLNVLAKYLPEANAALVNVTNAAFITSVKPQQAQQSHTWARQGVADPALIYSEAVTLKIPDPIGEWKMWRGVSNAAFLGSDEIASIDRQNIVALSLVTFATLLVCSLICLASKLYVKPANEIAEALITIAHGNVEKEVPLSHRKDILGKISRAVTIFRDNTLALRASEIERAKKLELEEQERQRRETENAEQAAQMMVVVEHLGAGLQRLADCNIQMTIDEPFVKTFESIRVNFNDSLGAFQSTLEKVLSSTYLIHESGTEMRSSSETMAKRTEQQASALEQTSAALEEITATVNNSAVNAENTRHLVNEARDCTSSSSVVVSQAVDAMGRIEKSSQEISQIIGVIDEIAFQTNLLALNAGVEAARAGDAGRGFAVVAQEVRELAQRSASAAKQIKSLITNSAREVHTGVKLVTDTGSALSKIDEFVTSINSNVNAIATAVKEQLTGLKEISSAMNNIDQMTQQNAAMAEETAALSITLSSHSDTLTSLVQRFKMNRRSRTRDGHASGHSPEARYNSEFNRAA